MKRAIVLADIHFGKDSKKILKPVEKYMGDEKWDYLIYLGDTLDLDCISHHNKDKLRKVEGKRILQEYNLANEMLDRHQNLVGDSCEVVFVMGNHESRVERYIDANPSLEGLIEVKNGLRLKERSIREVRCYPDGEVFKIGKLMFTHGSFTSSQPAKKHLEAYNSSIVFGHLHSPSHYTGVSYDKKDVKTAYGLGCLCNYEQDYMGKAPSKWKQSFGVVYFQPSGDFNLYNVEINNGGFFAPNSVYYS